MPPSNLPPEDFFLRRRDFLRQGSAATAFALFTGRSGRRQEPVFRHGVASGDPLPDRVVLWTRVSARADRAVPVRWVVARDVRLSATIASGTTEASPDRDHTVHVDAAGLEPGTTYYFAFEAGGERSEVGRTRTAPEAGSAAPVRIGVVSCGSFAYGFFNAYARLAERDVDLVVHLGDAIYDTGSGTRAHEPGGRPSTLAAYRARHAQYRADAGLRLLLQRHPVAAVWDDHEIAGNAWTGGAGAHDPARDGPWAERRAAATRAYLEWMPVRPAEGAPGVWRSLPLGRVAELLLLDTRLDGRSRQVSEDDPDPAAALADPARSLVGDAQRTWLHGRLRESPAAWRVLANQVMLSPLQVSGLPGAVASALAGVAGAALAVDDRLVNPDQWDGYVAERARLLDVLGERPGRTVVLTGDIHSSWASEVPSGAETGGGAPVAVEVVTPAVASETFGELLGPAFLSAGGLATSAVRAQNPHVRWADLGAHGYVVVELRADSAAADWWHVSTVDEPAGGESFAAGWDTALGEPRLERRDEPLGRRGVERPPAPEAAVEPPGGDGGGGVPAWGWGAAAAGLAAAAVAVLRARRRA